MLVEAEQLGRVRRLTLNRPEKRNALSFALLDAIEAALDAAMDDPETSVVVLRGAGKGFCAGFDLTPPSAATPPPDIWADRERLRRMTRRMEAVWHCPLPIIAQVHGFALAGGSDLALHCDLMVVSQDARIGYPPVRDLGVPPTNLWVYRLGPQTAKRMLLTGDSVSGAEAERIGMAVEAWGPDELDDGTLALAQRMALVGREMLIGNKFVINRGVDLMGRGVLASFATTEDALAHASPVSRAFRQKAFEHGLGTALRERDEPFAEGDLGRIARRSS